MQEVGKTLHCLIIIIVVKITKNVISHDIRDEAEALYKVRVIHKSQMFIR